MDIGFLMTTSREPYLYPQKEGVSANLSRMHCSIDYAVETYARSMDIHFGLGTLSYSPRTVLDAMDAIVGLQRETMEVQPTLSAPVLIKRYTAVPPVEAQRLDTMLSRRNFAQFGGNTLPKVGDHLGLEQERRLPLKELEFRKDYGWQRVNRYRFKDNHSEGMLVLEGCVRANVDVVVEYQQLDEWPSGAGLAPWASWWYGGRGKEDPIPALMWMADGHVEFRLRVRKERSILRSLLTHVSSMWTTRSLPITPSILQSPRAHSPRALLSGA